MGLPHSSQFVRLSHHCTIAAARNSHKDPELERETKHTGPDQRRQEGPHRGARAQETHRSQKPRSHERQPNCDRNWMMPSTPAGVRWLVPEPACRGRSVPILGSEARDQTQESEIHGKVYNKEGLHRLLESTSKPRSM